MMSERYGLGSPLDNSYRAKGNQLISEQSLKYIVCAIPYSGSDKIKEVISSLYAAVRSVLAGSAKAPGLDWVGPEIRCKEGVSRCSKEWHYGVGSLGGRANTIMRSWACGRGWSHINTTHPHMELPIQCISCREERRGWDESIPVGSWKWIALFLYIFHVLLPCLHLNMHWHPLQPACLASQSDLAALVSQICFELCTPSWLQKRSGSKHLERISLLKTNSCYWSRNYSHRISYVKQTVLCLRVGKDEGISTVK